MAAQAFTEAEISDMMAEMSQALTGAADVMGRYLPLLTDVLTEENRAAGMIRGVDIPATQPVFNPDGSQSALGQPAQFNPEMTAAIMKKYTDGLADFQAIYDALAKTRGTATRSALDKIRIWGRSRRLGGLLPGVPR